MNINKGGKSANHFVWLLVIAAFILLVNYLIFETLYLRCLFKEITGYDCPACGAQRAITSLLHGDFGTAFWHNPYLIILTPIFIVLIGANFFKKSKNISNRKAYHNILIALLAILMIAWTIIRNLPIWKDFAGAQLVL